MAEREEAIEAIKALLERADISKAEELIRSGVSAREIVYDGTNIVTGAICCNAGCQNRLSLLKKAANLVSERDFAELLRSPILVLTPNKAKKLIARGIEITPDIEKKYAEKHTAFEISTQYHSFEFLKQLFAYLKDEKHTVLTAEEKSSIRRIALNRPVFCTEEEIDAILNTND